MTLIKTRTMTLADAKQRVESIQRTKPQAPITGDIMLKELLTSFAEAVKRGDYADLEKVVEVLEVITEAIEVK